MAIPMRTALFVATAIPALLLAGCANNDAAPPPPPIIPKADVDTDGWRSELISKFDAIPDVDMDKMYELTVENCESDVSQIWAQLAFAADRHYNTAETMRASMRQVCPSREHLIDEAEANMREARSCRGAPQESAVRQKAWSDFGGCSSE